MARQHTIKSNMPFQDVASMNLDSHPPNTPPQLKPAAPPANMSNTVTTTNTSSASPTPFSGKNSISRPSLPRSAATAAAVVQPFTTTAATPLLSRPLTTRSSTSTGTPQRPSLHPSATTSAAPNRPSLLRRATDFFDLVADRAISYRNAPPTPTFWSDYPHRKALVKIWDFVHEAAASRAKVLPSLSAQVAATEKRMLVEYGELAEGATPLDREWVEFVLGVCMRPPFCTAARMGRFEILATSAGGRANWGPW